MQTRNALKQTRCWVIKLGSAILTNNQHGLDTTMIADWGRQIAKLHAVGVKVVLVSSGAIAEGMRSLHWRRRPVALPQLQAAAALGQMGLVQAYKKAFSEHQLLTAQILLTHADLANRQRYLNARSTLRTLLGLNVIPVVNENDSVVNDEIRFGDNDTLAALVANLVEADVLTLLTDQQGLYETNPRLHPEARLIDEGTAGDPDLERMADTGGVMGRGGMITKLQAASKAARSGALTIIASGLEPDVLLRLHAGDKLGTVLWPRSQRWQARQQWLGAQMRIHGRLTIDEGAVRVLKNHGRSLLPVGVTRVTDHFDRGDLVVCEDSAGREVARGLVNYNADEAGRIAGLPSEAIESVLGYITEPEMIHRDNLVLSGN